MNLRPKSILTYLSIFIPLFLGSSKFLFSLKISLSEFLLTCIISLIVNAIIYVDNLKDFIQKGMPLIDLAGKTNLTDELIELISCYETATHHKNEFLSEHLRDIFGDLKSEIETIANGQIEITEEALHTHLVIKIAKKTNYSLDATVLWSEDDLLKKDRRYEYDEIIEQALKNRGNFCVRRLYIFDNESDLKNGEVISRMKKDDEAGINVRWCFADRWQGVKGIQDAVDFGIFDKKNLWIYRRKNQDGSRTADIFTKKERIERFQLMFNANWDSANRYEPGEARKKEEI